MFLYLSPPAGYAAFFSTIWPFIRGMVTLSAGPADPKSAAWGFPSAGIGQSGGARVICLYVPEQKAIYLVMIYGKSWKKNLTQDEKMPSGKLRTKSEILAALDKMEFSGPALVSVARRMG